MIKTKVLTYKNRPRFVKAFAYFCLEKYKDMLKKSLFPNVEAKGINHGKHQLIKEDGTFVDFDSFINNLKVINDSYASNKEIIDALKEAQNIINNSK